MGSGAVWLRVVPVKGEMSSRFAQEDSPRVIVKLHQYLNMLDAAGLGWTLVRRAISRWQE